MADTTTDTGATPTTQPLFPQITTNLLPLVPGVFSGMTLDSPSLNTNRNSDEQTKITAGLGALAQQKLNLADFAPDSQSLSTLIGDNQQIIQNGQEKELRGQIAQASSTDALNRNLKLQSDIAHGNNPYVPLMDAVNQGMTLADKTKDADALEDHGIAQLQLMAAQDPDQAALMSTLTQSGTLIHQMHDNATKMAIFGREIDVLQQAHNEENWVGQMGDFARSLWPTMNMFARTGNVPGSNTELTDLPSTRENKEANTLWNMPLDKFKQNIPGVMENFTSQLFGQGEDYSKGLEVAKQYYQGGLNNSDGMSANFWDAVDVASVIPTGTLLKIARTPSKIARLVGNRVGSADIVAGDLARDINGVADPAKTFQDPASTIEESLPSSMAAGATRPDIGIPADVARRLNETRATVQAVRDNLPQISRLEPNQLQEAVQRAVETAQSRFTDHIADYKAVISDTEPGEFPKVQSTQAPILNDPEADLDNLSYFNARGEVYHVPEEPPFKTNAMKVMDEHDADMASLDAEAVRRFNEGSTVSQEVSAQARAAAQAADNGAEVGGIRSIPTLSQDKESGIYSLNFYLGKNGVPGGFLTKEGAEAAATRKGLGSFEVHQNSDAQYFVKTRQPVIETGIAQPALTRADFKGVYSASQYLKSFDNIQPELFNRARITATLGKSKAIDEMYKPFVKNIQGVSAKSRRLVAKVAASQEEAQRWFTHAEFEDAFSRGAGRLPTDKESLAFYSARELSDLNWHTFNNEVYTQKARRGLQSVRAQNAATGYDTGKINGQLIDNPDFDKLRIYDVDEGRHYPPGTATPQLTQKLKGGKVRVIDLESPVKNPGDDPIKTVMVHENSSSIGPLARDQLGYVEGGSRENRFKWFVKQADQGVFQDGTKYWDRPITHIAARTHAQADAWAKGMEQARLAYSDKTLSEAEKRLIVDRTPAESYDRFSQMVAEGKINPDHPFETLFDREEPKAMSHIGDKDAVWANSSESAQEQYMISKGRMYYSKKGDRLRDPSGDYAEILDPFTTLNRAMENAAQTNAFSDYNKKVTEEWARTAAPYLDKNSLNGGSDPYNVFMNGKISPNLLRSKDGQAFANQLEMVRNTHKRFMYGQNPEQRLTYTASRRFANWVETKGKWTGKIGDKLAQVAYDKMSANPVAAAKGYVYDIHIGMFNPTRLWLHTQTAAMAFMQHPLFGTRSMAMLPWVEHAMMNGSENVLDYYAKNLSFVHGLDPQDWKTMVRSMQKSGWLNVSGEQLMLDRYMGAIGGSAIKKGVDNVREWGRIFQNISERFNRVNAYQIAWQKMRQQFPKMAGDSEEFLGRVNRETDLLDNNMTTSSQAWWQRGPTSIPTQFMAYQTRMLERILPKTLGGSDAVSSAQKLRLAVGSMLLYGAGGAPGGKEFLDWVNGQYAAANGGKPMSADTQREFGRGIYDTALHQLSGGKLDTDISARAGLGGFVDDLYQKLTNGDMNSVLGVMTGPIGETAGSTWKAINKVKMYMKAEQTGTVEPQTWGLIAGDAAQQLSTVNNGLKAYWVWKAGQLRDPKSGEPITSEDQMYVITHALGIPSFSEVDRWDLIAKNKDREANVKDLGKTLAGIRRQAFQAMIDGDEQKQTYYNQLASGVMQQFHGDPLLMQQAAQEANKELSRNGFSYDQLKIQSANKTGMQPAASGDNTEEQ